MLSVLDPILGDDTSTSTAAQTADIPLTNDLGVNQITDFVQSVTSLLDGQDTTTTTITPAAGQLTTPTATTESSPLDLAGDGAITQPALDAANSLITQVHFTLETLAHETGTANAVHGITNLGETVGLGKIGIDPQADGHTNLVTDVLNAPGDVLNGNLDGIISNVGHDLTDVVNSTAYLVDTLLLGVGDATNPTPTGDPINPIPELIQSIGHDLQTLPILSVNDGSESGSGSDGGLLGESSGGLLNGIVGDLSGSSSNHLADVAVGPEQSQDGLVLNVLAAPESSPQHAVDVNAVDVGSTGPHIADLGLLTGENGMGIPLLGGTGGDGLVGDLLNVGTSSSDTLTTPPAIASAPAPIAETGNLDLGAIINADHGILNLHSVHVI